MIFRRTVFKWLPCLIAVPLFAQPQIGGGTCNSGTLNGTYSLSLSGRDLGSSVFSVNVFEGVGTISFDGLSKVTLTFTANTNKQAAQALTWSGTYSLPTNCVGTINVNSGDAANFTIEAYSTGSNYLLLGSDGSYLLTGNGAKPPTSACSASTLNGTYEFNASGVTLNSGAIVYGTNLAGTMVFNGTGGATSTWILLANRTSTTTTTSGSYTLTTGCTGTAALKDSSGNTYNLTFSLTAATGSNFALAAASPGLIFLGNGRIL